MNNDVFAPNVPATAEGTTLPPPRAFGETNTLTVPGSRRRKRADDLLALIGSGPGAPEAGGHVHLAVVPADATPVTLTF